MMRAPQWSRAGSARKIALPGWDEHPFVCRARRPSLLQMAAAGHIPNPLLPAAQALFEEDDGALEKLPLDQQGRVLVEIARAALAEPTLEQLEQAGVQLTDEQLLALYVYAMGGAAALEPFRQKVLGVADRDDDALRLPALAHAGIGNGLSRVVSGRGRGLCNDAASAGRPAARRARKGQRRAAQTPDGASAERAIEEESAWQ